MKKTTDLTGAEAYHAWMTSPQFAALNKNMPPEYVMRVFLPPVPQTNMQMESPLPPNYQQWLQEFNEARKAAKALAVNNAEEVEA